MLAVEADRHPEMSNSPSRSPRALEARASETRRPSPKTASVLRASKVWSATRKSRALTRLRRPKTRSGVVRRGSYAEDLRNRRSLELNLSSDESEDFKSDVRLHFRHRDFDPLRRFEGLSSLPTYLTLVISRLFLDHRNGLSGRWRTSTEAKRLGPSAIPIERLVAHDAWTSDRVVAMFRINHRRHVGFGSFALSPTGEPSIGPQGDCLLGLA